jgi:hypothetical protein
MYAILFVDDEGDGDYLCDGLGDKADQVSSEVEMRAQKTAHKRFNYWIRKWIDSVKS